MPFDPDQYIAQKSMGSDFDPDAYLAAKTTPPAPGYMESALRGGAQGLTLGFADELAGAGGAALDAIKGSDSDLVSNYIQHRNDYRAADQAAAKANPKTYFGGQLTGGLATAAIPGLNIGAAETLAGRALGAGALGATAALGNSKADLTQGDYAGAAKDTAIGGALGTVLQPAIEKVVAPAVGRATDKLSDLAGWAGKKSLNVAFDTPESLTEGYLQNPEAYNNALSREGVAQKLADTFGDVRNDTGPAAEAALSSLSTERQPIKGMEADKAIELLRGFKDPSAQELADKLESEYSARAPGMGAPARPTTITRKSQFVKQAPEPVDYSSGLSEIARPSSVIGETNPEGAAFYNSQQNAYSSPEENPTQWLKQIINKRVEGVPETPLEAQYLTERELHDVKKTLQEVAGNWKSPLPTFEMARARIASGDLNQILKSENMDYQTAMGDLAQNIQSKNALSQKFGIQPDFTGNNESGYTFSDRSLSALKDIVRGNKVDRSRVLDSLKDQGYGDLADDIEKSLGKSYFEGQGATNGGRRVYAGVAAGAGLGHATGIPGAPWIMGALGGQAGAAVDKYGPQLAKKALDATILVNKLSSTPGAERFAGAIQSAASQGQGALAATHFILSQTEPDYQKAVSKE